MRVVGIVQARMASTRLPGKVLADIKGQPMLGILLERLSSCDFLDEIVVATTNNQKDDELCDWLQNAKALYFRGSEFDVLDRFYNTAIKYDAEVVVRITADDPLKDPLIIKRALDEFFLTAGLDYCSNTIKPSYPEGLDIEVIGINALRKAFLEARLDSEREHVTPYIWKHPNIFKCKNFEYSRNLSLWRWTVDKQVDLDFIRAVFDKFGNDPLVGFEDIVLFLESKEGEKVRNINLESSIRNEGYLKSVFMETK